MFKRGNYVKYVGNGHYGHRNKIGIVVDYYGRWFSSATTSTLVSVRFADGTVYECYEDFLFLSSKKEYAVQLAGTVFGVEETNNA